MNFIDQFRESENKYYENFNKLKFLERFIGYQQLYKIYSDMVSNYMFRPSQADIEKFKEIIPDNSLLKIKTGKTEYKIVLDFISEYGPGEYFPVNKLFETMNEEQADMIKKNIDVIEDILFKNSIKMFNDLSVVKRKTYPMLEVIRKIKPKNNKNIYMYQYPHHDFKEYRLGLIAIQI